MRLTHRLPAALVGLLFIASPLLAQTVQPDFWGVVNGRVTAVARVANTIYLAGWFGYVGPSTGGGVPLDPGSGAPQRPFPRVAGTVFAAIPDGGGGWYIGGEFTAVEGAPRQNLAQVLADGTVAPWNPQVTDPRTGRRAADPNPIGVVSSLALAGRTLYVGGKFLEIAGVPRPFLAAVEANTGALLDWTPNPNGPVMALAIHAGRLYVGGRFTSIGGAERRNVAALDMNTGAPTPWRPDASGAVLAFGFSGRTVFVGGEFDDVGGQIRNSIAALDAETGAATSWNAQLRPLRRYLAHGDWIWPFVSSLVVRGSTLYAGGAFDSLAGVARSGLAGIDVVTGRATSFDGRKYGGYTKALALHANTLYVGGYLYDIGGAQRPNLAALDARTGDAIAFNPRCYGIVLALAADSRSVFAGGNFTSVYDWMPRPSIVALDAATGVPLSWNPQFQSGPVTRMIGTDRTLYVAGEFTAVDGQPRGHLAAFDAAGRLTDWNPWSTHVTPGDPFDPVGSGPFHALLLVGRTLYLGGSFEQINGVPRHALAAVDAETGVLLDWAPRPRGGFHSVGGYVNAMAPRGDTLFIAGEYDTIGGAPRRDLSAIDATTGLAYPWDTEPGFPNYRSTFPSYRAIVAGDEGVFVGGWFGDYHTGPRVGLEAFDGRGSLLPWDVGLETSDWIIGSSPEVRDLVLRDGMLFVAGRFDEIGGREISNLAILEAATGTPIEWNPDLDIRPAALDGGAETLCLYGDMLYVGGSFLRLGGYPQAGFSAVSLAAPPARRAQRLAAIDGRVALAPAWPNPARAEVSLGFALPRPAVVTLAVYDVQGRRNALPLDGMPLPAGAHEVRLSTLDWKAGCYFYSLDVAGERSTRRMVVVR
jgi:hypothetical protein